MRGVVLEVGVGVDEVLFSSVVILGSGLSVVICGGYVEGLCDGWVGLEKGCG